MSQLVPSDSNNVGIHRLKKVTYTVENKGSFVSITAHLPEGFTMPTFTRMYRLSHAQDAGMTPWQYVEYQKGKLFEDLLARISDVDKTKLLE